MYSATRRLLVSTGIVFAGCSLMTGCTNMKYVPHIDPSLKNAKIPASTIAVFPIDKMNYQPPSSCIGSSDMGDQSTYQKKWNDQVRKTLDTAFKNHKLVFLSPSDSLLSKNIVDFYTITETSKRFARKEQINTLKPDTIIFEPLATSPEMQANLQKLKDATGANYAVVFVEPSLSGAVHTTYTYSPNGGGASSQTVYTADVQTLVWDCTTGQLLFSSGGWCSTSSPCFLITPQNMAIDGANSQFRSQLKLIISRLINYDTRRYMALNDR